MTEVAKKVTPDELEDLFSSSIVKKKKKKKFLKDLKHKTKEIKEKIKKEKSELSGLSRVEDILKSKKGPSSVVKKYGEDATSEIEDWLSSETGFLEGLTEDSYGNPTRLYGYQIRYLEDKNSFIHIDKARQTGFSYIYAGRALAKSHLNPFHTSLFISINQEEANEKITYSRALFESLPFAIKKRCVVDNKHTLEFEDPSGKKQSRTRIISHAQREPRGKGGNVDVYLDEAAHYTWGDQIYVAAVPIISRGTGTLTIGSSPLGKKGIHFEIMDNDIYRKIYSYHQIWWWNCMDFVKKGLFKEAQKKAKFLTTEERVVKYGSEKIIGIFISMDLDSFQQEYELLHLDEAVSFFPIDLINQCTYEVLVDSIFLEDDEYSQKLSFPMMETYPEIDFKLYETVEDLAFAVQKNKVNPNLLAGYDVGRKHHTGEFAIIEEIPRDPIIQVIRHLKSFRDKKFVNQKSYLKNFLDLFPRAKLKIDQGGIGADMSEDLGDYSWKVTPVDFTNAWKEEVCSDFRIRLEETLIGIPNLKYVKNQIHSIKRKVSESGKFIFDAEKNKNHHGDVFWAIAMASSLGERPSRRRLVFPTSPSSREDTLPRSRIVPFSSSRMFKGKAVFGTRVDPPQSMAGMKLPDEILKLHRIAAGNNRDE